SSSSHLLTSRTGLLFLHVSLHNVLIDLDPQPWPRGDVEVALLQFKLPGDDLVAERVLVDVKLHHRLVPRLGAEVVRRKQRQNLERRRDRDGAGPAVRRGLDAEETGHFGDEEDLANAASERDVRLDDVEGPPDDVVAGRAAPFEDFSPGD